MIQCGRRTRFWLVWSWVLLGIPQLAAALDPLVLHPSLSHEMLSGHVEFFEDPSGRLTIDAVTSAPYSQKFLLTQTATPNFGITASAYWVRFALQVADNAPEHWLLELDWALTDSLTFYAPNRSSAGFTSYQAGDFLPFEQREGGYRNPLFHLALEPGAAKTFYMRLAGCDSLYVPLNLWTPEAFAEKRANESMGFGFFLGAVGVMILYNLLIFISIRDLSYLYYVLMMLGALVWYLSYTGLASQYLWPDSVWWANHAIHVGGIFTGMFFCFMWRAALMTRRHVPTLDMLLRGWLGATVVLLILQLFSVRAMNLVSPVVGGVAAVIIILSTLRTFAKGFEPARDFVLAWFLCMVAYVAWSLDTTYNAIGSELIRIYALPFSFVVAPIFFSRGLGRRINTLQEEQQRAAALAREMAEQERRYREQEENAAVAAALAQVSQGVIAAVATPEQLHRLCQLTAEVLQCERAYTWLHDPEQGTYLLISQYGHSSEEEESIRLITLAGERMSGWLNRLAGESILVELVDAPDSALPQVLANALRAAGVTRSLSVALRRGEGLCALLQAGHCGSRESFTAAQRRIALGIAQSAPLALEAARLFEELSTANQVKEHFVATLSHELRNPIGVITGYQELLLEQVAGPLTPKQQEYLERAQRSTRELNALIIATLDLSRFSAKRVKIDWQDVQVGALLDELSREVTAPVEKPNLHLGWQCSTDAGILRSDPLKLKMILRNLMTNALKFTDHGRVCLDVRANDGGVEFSVSDTGAGIPREALPTLFDAFTQAHGAESRRKGGAGLGLHLVHRLVEVLGGNVAVVATEVGKGSTFRVWVPRQPL